MELKQAIEELIEKVKLKNIPFDKESVEKFLNSFYEDKGILPNEQQLEAIILSNGPVFVIAGPGTGKTELLTRRLYYMIKHQNIKSSEILCLTYTKIAAKEMQERVNELFSKKSNDSDSLDLSSFSNGENYLESLTSLLNSNPAVKKEEIVIKTFHSFCNDVIFSNKSLFNLEETSKGELAILEEEQLDKYIKKLIFEDPKLRYFAKTDNVEYYIGNIKKLYRILKSKNISSEELEKTERTGRIYYESWMLEEKKNNPKFKAKVEEKFEEDKKFMIHFSYLYKKLNQILSYNNKYLVDDIISLVLKKFSEDENFLKRYQQQFKYILVDEYQDTSKIQNDLIKKLISNTDYPNIFVVGDDDQSIFRFQGAVMENMIDLHYHIEENTLSSVKDIVLVNNYRSSQSILDASKDVIQCNENRLVKKLGLNKDLKAGNGSCKDLINNIYSYDADSEEEEVLFIVDKILELKKEFDLNTKSKNGDKSVGIIYPKNIHANLLEKALSFHGITYTKAKGDLRFTPEFKSIFTIFNVLKLFSYSKNNLSNLLTQNLNQELFYLLAQGFFGFDLLDALYINELIVQQEKELELIDEEQVPKVAGLLDVKYKQIVGEENKKAYFKDKSVKRNVFIDKLLYLRQTKITDIQELKRKESIYQKVQKLFSFIEMLREEYILGKQRYQIADFLTVLFKFVQETIPIPDGTKSLLFKFAEDFKQNHKQEGTDLIKFVRYLENKEISDIEELLKNSKENKYEVIKNKDNEFKVTLTTVHSSKGKEFDNVFLIQSKQKYWEGKRDSFSSKFRGFPKYLIDQFKEELKFENDNVDEEEITRLFYVGMTRARKSLYITYFTDKDKEDDNRTRFLDSIKNLIHIPQKDFLDSDYKIFDNSIYNLEENEELREFIKEKLKGFRFSYTHYKKIKESPRKFLETYILKLPTDKTYDMIFGNIIHEIIEEINKKKDIKSWKYEWNYLFAENMDEKQREVYIEKAKEIVSRYISQKQEFIQLKSLEEEEILYTSSEEEKLGGLKLFGIIDRLEVIEEHGTKNVYNLVEYKTGEGKFKETKYLEQLHFYDLLFYLVKNKMTGSTIKGLFVEVLQDNKDKGLLERKEFPRFKSKKDELFQTIKFIKDEFFDKLNFPEKFPKDKDFKELTK